MPNQDEAVRQATQDRGFAFNDFLDKVHERIAQRAKEEDMFGLRRVGNVWRLNNAEATITQGASPSDLLVTFRYGPDASRSSQYRGTSVDSTADAIIDQFKRLTRTVV